MGLLLVAGCSTAPKPFVPMPASRRTAPPPVEAALAAPIQTKSVTLAWTPSPSDGITSYRVYQGGKSGIYTNSYPSASTTYGVDGLKPRATYFFAVTAINSLDVQSTYSNEVSYRVPGGRVKLTTEQSPGLVNPQWSAIATNFSETDAASLFFRLLISTEEL